MPLCACFDADTRHGLRRGSAASALSRAIVITAGSEELIFRSSEPHRFLKKNKKRLFIAYQVVKKVEQYSYRGELLNLYPAYFVHEITRPFFFRTGSFFWFGTLVLVLCAICVVYTVSAFVFRLHEIRGKKSAAVVLHCSPLSNFFKWGLGSGVPLLSHADKAVHRCYTAAFILLSVVFLSFAAHVLFAVIPLFDFSLLTGLPYLLWSALRALANVFLLLAVGIDIFKRTIMNIPPLKTPGRLRLFFLTVTGFVFFGISAEAARIALNGRPRFEEWNFLAWPLSYLLGMIAPSLLEIIHDVLRFAEYSLLALFLAGFASPRAYQTILPLINICHTRRSSKRGDNYPSAATVDYRFADPDSLRAAHPRDLSAKERISLASCISCGNCQANCPAWMSEQILSPMALINKMAKAARDDISFADAGISRAEVDACFACAACMESCPSLIEHVPLITKLRTHTVSVAGQPSPAVHEKYRNLHYYGSVNDVHWQRRWEWLSRQDYIKTIDEQPDCDYLLFAGCGWTHPSKHRELLKFVEIAQLSGVKISTLVEKEACCGDMVLRTGNQYLFKKLAITNMTLFAQHKIKNILVLCPHGYAALDREYRVLFNSLTDKEKRKLSSEYKVTYYTDFISGIGREGKLPLKEMKLHATIHDPCYPARREAYYRAPRELLSNIPGIYLTEMRRSREHSFCCGMSGSLGSGNYKYYGQASEYRAREAISTGADTMVTACHFCRSALSEALLSIDEDKLAVRSLIEVLHESIFRNGQ